MTTARQLISDALLELGVIAEDEVPTAPQANTAFRQLNRMLGQWNIQGLATYAIDRNLLPLTAGIGSYTLGSAGTWDIPRPNKITEAYFRETSSGLELPMVVLTDEQYHAIRLKETPGSYTRWLYSNRAFPLSTVTVYPTPDVNNEVALYTWNKLVGFATLDTDRTYPDGYEEAITLNLAVRMAPSYGAEPSQITVTLATTGLAHIKSLNIQVPLLGIDAALSNRRTWDWRTGEII
jgi:hypothetical protein